MSEFNSLVSIVVPVYNSKVYLERCISSVLSQTYDNYEMILVDDASTDDSLMILERYGAEYPDKIKVIHRTTNGGMGAARNDGIFLAKGDYITFIDSDDQVTSDYLMELVDIIQDADMAIAGRSTYVDDRWIKSKHPEKREYVDCIQGMKYMFSATYSAHPAWGKLIKADIVRKCPFEEHYVFEDVRFSFDTMALCNTVVFSEKPLYKYMTHAGSVLTSASEKQIVGWSLAAEYVYSQLIELNLLENVFIEFNIFMARGIARNTREFVYHDVDVELFIRYQKKCLDIYENMNQKR